MADGDPRDVCERTGKHKFKRHQDAASALGRMRRYAKDVGAAACPKSFYQCQHCKRWHLTSYSPELTRAIQQHRRDRNPKAKPKVKKRHDERN